MLTRAARRIANLVFGGTCLLCRGAAESARNESLLCAACDRDLPRLAAGELCPRCALPSPEGAVCGACLATPPQFDATVAALAYRFPTDVLIQALKFRGALAFAALLGRELAQRASAAARVDAVLPVPLSAARLRERGYNQSMEIARAVARTSGVKLQPWLCERSRDTSAQVDLPAADRVRNVRGAFRCPRPLDGIVVAVVDDVMTTGATLDEIARALKRAGASRVVNWVAARTLPPEFG
ncbi:MAG TPA: ComF family protein [Burkholderiales bacterium]|nr:ComF family protein [Burkholderiales bacterium]